MKIKNSIIKIFSLPFFKKYGTILSVWIALCIVVWLFRYLPDKFNNFLIFKFSFFHAKEGLSLYGEYIDQYFDRFLYGPLFTIVIAPFAVLPTWMGVITWLLCLTILLFYAIKNLPVVKRDHILIFWFCSHELLTALMMFQFNVAIAALIILTYICIEKERDFWAALFIVLGTLTKLYGVVGLAFFLFSKHKLKFSLSLIAWTVALIALPMLFFKYGYIAEQYSQWFAELLDKNSQNLFSTMQNISLLGMVRKISNISSYSDLWIVIPGIMLFALPYIRFNQYKNINFRLTVLASVLLFTVLFSTSSESSTYIIALLGAAIWYVASPWKRSKVDIILMIFAFIVTSMSPSDLFPQYVRINYISPYALKALPCAIIWFKLTYELLSKDYCAQKI